MSDLQRSFAKAKLARLPFDPPLPADYRHQHSVAGGRAGSDQFSGNPGMTIDEESADASTLLALPDVVSQDDDSSSTSSASSTGTVKPSPSKHLFARPRSIVSTSEKRSFDALPWIDHFSQELYLSTTQHNETIIYHAYITPPTTSNGILLVTHHGAGSTGLSFALFASSIRKELPTCGVLSFDARGHGETSITTSEPCTKSDPNTDLTLENLSKDLMAVISLTRDEFAWSTQPDIVLIGHSLGGAVVTHLANSNVLGSALLGYVVLDVVEGSAINALQSMQQYLSTRPASFTSIPAAIEWHTRSRTLKSLQSARLSVPSLLKAPVSQSPSSTPTYYWRTNLSATQPYWQDWFTGLSARFLSSRGAKLLILAGTDRLDKELMIGQMQGKYQLAVFPHAGHFVHEDCAIQTAQTIAEFVKRNERGALVLPAKVGARRQ